MRALVLDLAVPHEAEFVARGPRVTKSELQAVIDLLEAHLVAEHILVEIAFEGIEPVVLTVERLPAARFAIGVDANEGPAARVQEALVDAIHRDVWEQRGLRRHAARGQAARGGNEQPVVDIRDDADEERIHPVDVADRVVALRADGFEATLYLDFTAGFDIWFLVQHVRVVLRV